MSVKSPQTLDAIVERVAAMPSVETAEIWTFDSPADRRIAATDLRRRGVAAHVRSAYKPLVFAVLEELDLDAVAALSIAYPAVAGQPAPRFRLEAYPVAELVAPRPVTFAAKPPDPAAGLLTYDLTLVTAGATTTLSVAVPTAFTTDATGATVVANTGWLRLTGPQVSVNQPVVTDLQHAFDSALRLVADAAATGAGQGDRFALDVAAPTYDHLLPVPHEHISTAEALHEDIYFAALEASSAPPGQIAPFIRRAPATDVRHRLSALPAPDSSPPDLAAADRPLSLAEVGHHLDAAGGTPYQARSQQGRPVWGRHFPGPGPGPGIVISGAQHGNETAGVIGALRAVAQCRRAGVNLAVAPVENPDGYALGEELRAANPTHMHHAARFTASGRDLEELGAAQEGEIRHLGRAKTGAVLHLNLHGYPAHEWTRPFSGYIPRGYETWTIPRGFFLILRAAPDHRDTAARILNAVVADLAAWSPLVDFNRTQIERYRRYLPEHPFEVRDHIPVVLADPKPDALFPITLVTESPDQGLSGEPYVLLHTAHMKAAGAAVAALAP